MKTIKVTTGMTISVSDTYRYDLRGNRTSKTGIGTTTQYIYDLNNRLLSTTEETADTSRKTRYYYDKNGNTISKATTEVAPSTGDTQYTISDTANSYVTFYDYNRYNRLTSAETDGVVSRYTYNADNLRATKTVGNITTEYVWDGQNLAAETKQGTTEAYTYDMTGVHTKKQEDEVTSYLKDYHGNMIGTADNTGRLDYDAYGNQLQGDAPDPFGYCGEYYDSETGLIYLRARYYDPTTGRFINEDPIKDGLNWYMYCEGNPVMFVDPSGLYDRNAAVNYALKYSVFKNTNPWEQTFDDKKPPVRFSMDCTNFVSFCLKAGDLHQSDDWYYNWTCGGGNYVWGSYSATWTNSEEQFKAFTNCTGKFPNSSYANGVAICIHESKWIPVTIKEYGIQKGDLLYFLNNKTLKMEHTAMIVSVDNGVIIYAQHDIDKNDGNLNEYLDKNGDDPNQFNYVFVVRIDDDA
ncbi:MAG: amidase domain-containing protein [Clostridiales bacterium]|nr:amidase domain-containing protein [Clostridiales bacterium]